MRRFYPIFTVLLLGGIGFLCSVTEGLGIQYYHNDTLGSVAVISDRRGEVVKRLVYSPFGEISSEIGKDSGLLSHFYTGQEFDPESALYDYGARDYDPVVARFTSVDPVVGRPAQPQSFNAYAYVWDNPIRRVDPDGRDPKDPIAPYARLRIEAMRIAREVPASPGRMGELWQVLHELDDMRVEIVIRNPDLAVRIESGDNLRRSLNRFLPERMKFPKHTPDAVSIARSLRSADFAVEEAGEAVASTAQSTNGILRLLRGPTRLLGTTAVVASTTYDVYKIGDEVYAGNYEEAGEYAAKLGIVGGSALALGPIGGAGAALILWVVEMTREEEVVSEEVCPMAHSTPKEY